MSFKGLLQNIYEKENTILSYKGLLPLHLEKRRMLRATKTAITNIEIERTTELLQRAGQDNK